MPRLFNRVLTFHVQGEIYDRETTPESIIKNYNWTFRHNTDGSILIKGSHKDSRGCINKMIKLAKIHKWRTPDTEFFLKM